MGIEPTTHRIKLPLFYRWAIVLMNYISRAPVPIQNALIKARLCFRRRPSAAAADRHAAAARTQDFRRCSFWNGRRIFCRETAQHTRPEVGLVSNLKNGIRRDVKQWNTSGNRTHDHRIKLPFALPLSYCAHELHLSRACTAIQNAIINQYRAS